VDTAEKREIRMVERAIERKKIMTLKQTKELFEEPMPFEIQIVGKVLYITGARINEFLKMRKKNFNKGIRGNGLYVTMELYTLKNRRDKARILPVYYSKPYEQYSYPTYKWLFDDVFDYLEGLGDDEPLTHYSERHLRRLIKKHFGFFPHKFRHMRLTHLSKYHKYDGSRLMLYAGWSNTKPATVYVHLNWNDLL